MPESCYSSVAAAASKMILRIAAIRVAIGAPD
jgi:hypothetical protein